MQAAKRELAEELGAAADTWTDLGTVNPFTTVINSPNYIYLARGLRFSDPQREGTESIEIVRMPLKEAAAKIGTDITHGASCIAILKAYEMCKS